MIPGKSDAGGKLVLVILPDSLVNMILLTDPSRMILRSDKLTGGKNNVPRIALFTLVRPDKIDVPKTVKFSDAVMSRA